MTLNLKVFVLTIVLCAKQGLRSVTYVDKSADAEDQLTASAFHTYVFLVKAGKPVGPRDVMRGANLTSPSVAYRNLQKLIDWGLVVKDEYGNNVVKEKVGLKGHV